MSHANTPQVPEDADAQVIDPKAKSPKVKKELSVVSLPHDNDVMAQEMAELFDEDRVTHQHGSAEPEKD
jgi:hypothetical protein